MFLEVPFFAIFLACVALGGCRTCDTPPQLVGASWTRLKKVIENRCSERKNFYSSGCEQKSGKKFACCSWNAYLCKREESRVSIRGLCGACSDGERGRVCYVRCDGGVPAFP